MRKKKQHRWTKKADRTANVLTRLDFRYWNDVDENNSWHKLVTLGGVWWGEGKFWDEFDCSRMCPFYGFWHKKKLEVQQLFWPCREYRSNKAVCEEFCWILDIWSFKNVSTETCIHNEPESFVSFQVNLRIPGGVQSSETLTCNDFIVVGWIFSKSSSYESFYRLIIQPHLAKPFVTSFKI